MRKNKMRLTYSIGIFFLMLAFACYGQSNKNDRWQYHDSTVIVDRNNVPVNKGQYYFPLEKFPESVIDWEYKDSTSILISTSYESNGDSIMFYSRILPNEQDTFRVEWYSEHLFAMKEPLLYNVPVERQVYRFTWLRTFDHPVTIRMEKSADGFMLYWKVCSGAGGYDPGRLITNRKRKLKLENWEEFNEMVHAANFWSSQNVSDLLGTDGSQWILEGSTPEKYHIIDMWSPENNYNYYRACNYLIDLTKIRIKENKRY